ncbi:MAG TPA: hypothetical protein DIU15_04575 [Deltaproteobacteria bacterium]|nr:hypothetical protein [Deltaproteobacteria bacterium]HCP45289.1 hypothetical protein [Deltaproteobacteria bacterium]
MDIQRFVPVGSYHGFVAVHDGQIVPRMKPGIELMFNFGYRPLQTVATDLRRSGGAIDALFAGHLRGGFGITDWVEVNVGMGFMQFASTGPGIEELGGKQQLFSLGDLWLEGRFRPLKEETHFVSLAAIPFFTFPTGNPNLFLTSGIPTVGVKVAVSKRMDRVHLAGHLGYRLKAGFGLLGENVVADDEVLYGIGVGVAPIPRIMYINLELVGTGIVGPGLSSVEKFDGVEATHSPLELLVNLRFRFKKGVDVVFGGGPGITPGVGTPAFRLFAGVSYAPIRDKDKDGILDAVDECPEAAEDMDGFEDSDGCPDPDNDMDTVLDGDDACPDVPEDRDEWEDDDGCPEEDNDEDGLLDADDTCPDDAEDVDGFEDEDGCPETDNDGDLILDDVDRCPLAAEDLDQWQDEDGCPDEDNDGDTIPDASDLCPNDPEVFNQLKDEDGCPDDVMAVVHQDQIVILEKILFVVNKARILRRSAPVLDAVRKTLEENPQIQRVRIEGHTDNNGTDRDNQVLSEKRATAVMNRLIKDGVEPGRLVAVGFGETKALADNATEDGRERNRRVEFTILQQEKIVEGEVLDLAPTGE